MKVLLVSTYDLGRQPFGLASPAAWLRQAGAEVGCLDLAVEAFREDAVSDARLVAIHVPMHTATRLAETVIRRARESNPGVHICCFGLYAPANADWLRRLGADSIVGGEFEGPLTGLYRRLRDGAAPRRGAVHTSFDKQAFRRPDRGGLPPLDRYARLIRPDGRRGVVGYTEASRGCKHRCRHCPVVPVYDGRFRVVQRQVVMADVRQLAARGAEHITFGDPDFFNGPGHAVATVRALHAEFPELTYDVTIKIEHLLAHADRLSVLKETGCLFVTTAAESVEDRILALLDKGHTQADFVRAAALCREHGIGLSPTFIPFTPWTTIRGYVDLLATVDGLGLVEALSPIQLAIRLLVPRGSRLRGLEAWREHEGPFDEAALSYGWVHPDPTVEGLYAAVRDIVAKEEEAGAGPRAVFSAVWRAAHDALGRRAPPLAAPDGRPPPVRMSEAWYCCAEPTDLQRARLHDGPAPAPDGGAP